MAYVDEDPVAFFRRILSTVSADGLDFVKYLSECPAMGIDPTTPVKINACTVCWDTAAEHVKTGNLEELVKHIEETISSCSCSRNYSFNDRLTIRTDICVYELAAAVGQIEVLYTLPAHFDDLSADWNPSAISPPDISSDPAAAAPPPPPPRHHKYCFHGSRERCYRRCQIVSKALRRYIDNKFPLHKVIDVVKSQPCSEDVLVFFSLLPERKSGSGDGIAKAGTLSSVVHSNASGNEVSVSVITNTTSSESPVSTEAQNGTSASGEVTPGDRDVTSVTFTMPVAERTKEFTDDMTPHVAVMAGWNSNSLSAAGNTIFDDNNETSKDVNVPATAIAISVDREMSSETATMASDNRTMVSEDGSQTDVVGVFVKEFAETRGAHTGNTLLIQACRDLKETFVDRVLRDPRTDMKATNDNGADAFRTLLRVSAGGNFETKKHILSHMKQHGFQVWPYIQPLAECEDQNATTRKMQATMCLLAWEPHDDIREKVQEIDSVLCTPISIKYCWECRVHLFPNADSESSFPHIVFSRNFDDNADLFRIIERGECPCSRPEGRSHKVTLHFLPACAAITGGNVKLFHELMGSFCRCWLQPEQEKQRDERSVKGEKTSSGFKPCIKDTLGATGSVRGKSHKKVSMAECLVNAGSLVAEVLCHAVYAGHAEVALQAYDTVTQEFGLRITADKKISLLDMALRMGDEETFWQFVSRFGLDVRCTSSGLTPLLLAVRFSRVELALRLLKCGAKRGVGDFRSNAVELALRLETPGAELMALTLLKNGEGLTDRDNPLTPSSLQSAIEHNSFKVVDYIVDVLKEVEIPVERKVSAKEPIVLFWAPAVAWCLAFSRYYTCERVAMARYLVEKGLDWRSPYPESDRGVYGERGLPLLHMAVKICGKTAIGFLDLLLQKGIDVNEATSCGRTPIVIAMEHHNTAVVCRLLLAGAKLDSPIDPHSHSQMPTGAQLKSRSFLWRAVEKKHAAMIRLALRAGYRARLEPWFATGDYPASLTPDCVAELTDPDNHTLPLTFRCRKVLRDHVGSALPKFVETVGIPDIMKDFVLMKDLVDDLGKK